MKRFLVWAIAFVLLLLASSDRLQAQILSSFNEISIDTSDIRMTGNVAAIASTISLEASMAVGSILNSRTVKTLWVGSSNSVRYTHEQGGKLDFIFPWSLDTLTLERPTIVVNTDQSVWTLNGFLTATDRNQLGISYDDAIANGNSIYMTTGDDYFKGYAYVDGKYLEFWRYGSNTYLLECSRVNVYNLESCDECSINSADHSNELSIKSSNIDMMQEPESISDEILSMCGDKEHSLEQSNTCIVDICVVYTEPAISQLNSDLGATNLFTAEAASYISQINSSLSNSQIFNVRYNLVFTGILQDSRFSDAGLRIRDLFNIATENEEDGGQIQQNIQTYKCDQYMIIIPEWRDPTRNDNSGISELLSQPSDRNITLVRRNNSSDFVASHEIGHNHGCTHEFVLDPGAIIDLNVNSKGYNNQMDDFGTILSVLADTRVMYYSTPDFGIQYGSNNDAEIGTTSNNCADQIRSTGCELANLVDDQNDDFFFLYPLTLENCSSSSSTWISYGGCNNGTLTIPSWEMSVNGGGFFSITPTYLGYATYSIALPHNYKRRPMPVIVRVSTRCGDDLEYQESVPFFVSQCLNEPDHPYLPAALLQISPEGSEYLQDWTSNYNFVLKMMDESPISIESVQFTNMLGQSHPVNYQISDIMSSETVRKYLITAEIPQFEPNSLGVISVYYNQTVVSTTLNRTHE